MKKPRAPVRIQTDAELIVPISQLRPIVDRDGRVLRGARLEAVEGEGRAVRIVRRNVIGNLFQTGERRRDRGEDSLIRREHVQIAERFARDWDLFAGGVSPAPIDLLNAGGSSRGSGSAGGAADAAMWGQIQGANRLTAVLRQIGQASNILIAVVVQGMPIQVVAVALGVDRHQVVGYLAASLDRLRDAYAIADDRGT